LNILELPYPVLPQQRMIKLTYCFNTDRVVDLITRVHFLTLPHSAIAPCSICQLLFVSAHGIFVLQLLKALHKVYFSNTNQNIVVIKGTKRNIIDDWGWRRYWGL
jgi:hypothetical protein